VLARNTRRQRSRRVLSFHTRAAVKAPAAHDASRSKLLRLLARSRHAHKAQKQPLI